MQCKTFSHINPETNEMVFKDKRKFDTLEEAITEAKRVNSMPHKINKVVSYKCSECFKFHIGRNGKPIRKKYL